ncbi:hypothetical protein P4V71_28890 [Bacillus thuringiensis]|uniref:hypothetical protein n=1 Tax=Bacillus thuringiensis TaxID=1428 RepID=UPI0005AF4074|nr:hypothetical protein [Bacillus thuringiensis]KIP28146.1 hypothetical protein BG10_3570 [Bacillus thuringiensis serovar morrisoni]MED2066924.1 hypothetical protein [Bacillus thuringiensis]MED2076899.1 hypothetical protein [Bacillus thuringiensis]MEE2015971.1 hypothetical protein [Bacillus thuringiensis]NUW52086.1 hypothetical protein [Bacillus thuringiensis]
MRHTRNRQMTKIGAENFMGMKNFKISTIRKFDGKFDNRLDSTFKWQRDLKTVQFDTICKLLDLSIETMATKVICLKYPNGVPRFVSIYPHQLDC